MSGEMRQTDAKGDPRERARILVVEDEALIALDITETLNGAGYDVVGVARRCKTALELAEQTQPDLVLMDIALAGRRSGAEAATIIRDRYGIPSLFVSSRPLRDLSVHAAVADAAGWLPKPATPDRLKRAVADALSARRRERVSANMRNRQKPGG